MPALLECKNTNFSPFINAKPKIMRNFGGEFETINQKINGKT